MNKDNKKYIKINKNFFSLLSKSIINSFFPIILLVLFIGILSLFPSNNFYEWTIDLLNLLLNLVFIFVCFFLTYFLVEDDKKNFSFFFLLFILILFFLIQNFFISNNLIFFAEKKEFITKNFFYLNVFSILFLPLIFISILLSFFTNNYFKKNIYKFLSYLIFSTIFFTLFIILIWPLFYFVFFNSILYCLKLPFGLDAFFYGMFNRIFVLFGTQIITNAIFNYSMLGGQIISASNGVVANGEVQSWFFCINNGIDFNLLREASMSQQAIMVNNELYYASYGFNPGQYQQGILPITIFALPSIGIAYYFFSNDDKHKKKVLLASLLPFFLGLSEPIEVLFISYFPLYLFYSFIVGLNFMILDLLDVSVIISIGNIFDLMIFGIFTEQINNIQTNYQYILILGTIDFVLFFTIFSYFFKYKKKIFIF